jgi:hypothetical protein
MLLFDVAFNHDRNFFVLLAEMIIWGMRTGERGRKLEKNEFEGLTKLKEKWATYLLHSPWITIYWDYVLGDAIVIKPRRVQGLGRFNM